jgi:hypothetical protein
MGELILPLFYIGTLMSGTEIKISEIVETALSLLPDSNVLSCSELTNLLKNIISTLPENDCQYNGEALCKLLQAAGKINKGKASVDMGAKKREKVGELEIEYSDNNTSQVWDRFLVSLRDICPLYGYTIPYASKVVINPSEKFTVNPCPDVTKLTL